MWFALGEREENSRYDHAVILDLYKQTKLIYFCNKRVEHCKENDHSECGSSILLCHHQEQKAAQKIQHKIKHTITFEFPMIEKSSTMTLSIYPGRFDGLICSEHSSAPSFLSAQELYLQFAGSGLWMSSLP
jgi:hypothetical protein